MSPLEQHPKTWKPTLALTHSRKISNDCSRLLLASTYSNAVIAVFGGINESMNSVLNCCEVKCFTWNLLLFECVILRFRMSTMLGMPRLDAPQHPQPLFFLKHHSKCLFLSQYFARAGIFNRCCCYYFKLSISENCNSCVATFKIIIDRSIRKILFSPLQQPLQSTWPKEHLAYFSKLDEVPRFSSRTQLWSCHYPSVQDHGERFFCCHYLSSWCDKFWIHCEKREFPRM